MCVCVCVYNKTCIKRNIFSIKQNTSEVDRSKDLSAALYQYVPPICQYLLTLTRLHDVMNLRGRHSSPVAVYLYQIFRFFVQRKKKNCSR